MNSAPKARLVDALSGERAPAAFFGALSEADAFCAELDGLRELQCRVQELEAERDELADKLRLARADANAGVAVIGGLIAERDQLAEQLMASHNAHNITRSLLAIAKRHNNNEGK